MTIEYLHNGEPCCCLLFTHVFAVDVFGLVNAKMQMIDFVSVILIFVAVVVIFLFCALFTHLFL